MRNTFFVVLIVVIFFYGNTEALIINVPGDYPTIQQAINASVNGDTVLAAEGTYYENINFNGKNITVASNYIIDGDYSHIQNTIIDGSQPANTDTASCVRIVSGEDSSAVLEGFTITNGHGTKWIDEHGAGLYREGGGILITESSPVIRNNIIINNEAVNSAGAQSAGGGGIRCGDCNSIIENNIIAYNKGKYGGGIVFNYSTGIIRNNILAFNSGGEDFGGGGVWILETGPTILENNTIVNNSSAGNGGTAGLGGGVLVWNTTVNAKNNIIRGNTQRAGGQVAVIQSGIANITYSNIEGGFTGEGNIDLDPVFVNIAGEFPFLLDDLSPCIDAGDPAQSYNDVEDPASPGNALFPSKGTLRNDMGSYGGPAAKGIAAVITSAEEPGEFPLNSFQLEQNYPNPFNPDTKIMFSIAHVNNITLKIFNLLGEEIAELINGELPAGSFEINFNGEGLSSGIYLIKLQSGNYSDIKKMVLLR